MTLEEVKERLSQMTPDPFYEALLALVNFRLAVRDAMREGIVPRHAPPPSQDSLDTFVPEFTDGLMN